MSLTVDQKAEKAYKKATLGVAMTANDKAYYTEPASPITIRAKHVWVDDAKIPNAVPASPQNGAIYDEDANLASVSGKTGILQYVEIVMVNVPGSANSFATPTPEVFAIPFTEKAGIYSPVFIDMSNQSVIPFGTNAMEFDTSCGILTFYNNKPSTLNTVKAKYWRYVGRTLDAALTNMTQSQVFTYQLYQGSPNTVLTNTTFVVSHNKNIAKLDWSLSLNGIAVEPGSFSIVDNNSISITIDPVPVQADVLVLQLTKVI